MDGISILNNAKHIDYNKVDIIIDEIKTEYRQAKYSCSSLVEITFEEAKTIILFNFMDNDEEISQEQIYLVQETGLAFFMNYHQLGIIDLEKKCIIELKNAFDFGYPERVKNTIIFEDELSAKSYTLAGKFIDEVLIDPPTERKIFENFITYDSPIFGKRNLTIK